MPITRFTLGPSGTSLWMKQMHCFTLFIILTECSKNNNQRDSCADKKTHWHDSRNIFVYVIAVYLLSDCFFSPPYFFLTQRILFIDHSMVFYLFLSHFIDGVTISWRQWDSTSRKMPLKVLRNLGHQLCMTWYIFIFYDQCK